MAEGETDALILFEKIGDYVHNYIEYDAEYIGKLEKTPNILRDKGGVCVEYSNLMMSLARALSVPARYVTGYAYGTVYGDEFSNFPHAWIELYVPELGWVPYDPTFGEYGWIDATHFKTQISENIDEPALSVKYVGSEVKLELPEINIDILYNEESIDNKIDSEIWLQNEITNFESYNVLWMKLMNKENYYLHTNAFLEVTPKLLGKNTKSVLLKPKSEEVIGWIIKPQKNLDDKYIYTHSIESNIVAGSKNDIKLQLDPNSNNFMALIEVEELINKLEKNSAGFAKIEINIEDAKIYPGERTIDLIEVNIGTKQSEVSVCLENICKIELIGINEEKIVWIDINLTEGNNTLNFEVEYDSVSETREIIVVVQKQNILMTFIEFLRSILR